MRCDTIRAESFRANGLTDPAEATHLSPLAELPERSAAIPPRACLGEGDRAQRGGGAWHERAGEARHGEKPQAPLRTPARTCHLRYLYSPQSARMDTVTFITFTSATALMGRPSAPPMHPVKIRVQPQHIADIVDREPQSFLLLHAPLDVAQARIGMQFGIEDILLADPRGRL